VLAGIGLASAPGAAAAAVAPAPADRLEAAVLAALGVDSRTLDELHGRLGVEPGALMGVLVRLELAGRVRRGEDLRFARL